MASEHSRILADLKRASTATMTHMLFQRGYRNVFMAGLQVLRPDLRMAGVARTARMVPDRPDLRYGPERRDEQPYRWLTDNLGHDEIIVIDAHGDDGGGSIGDIMASRMRARGGAGLVVDGAVRDAWQIKELDLPVYARHVHGGAISRSLHSMEIDSVVACRGCAVRPGDYLAGDADGVVIVPAALAAEIAALAVEHEDEELFIRDKVKAGASLKDAYPMTPAVREEYERLRRNRS